MKQHAPSTERNRGPILEVLRAVLPKAGTVLEIASGTGEHALFFAKELPHLRWQPTDADVRARESIDAWRMESGTPNLLPPLLLDAASDDWPVASADALVCINMVHIAPWRATEGLMRGAARVLPAGGRLILYGAYFVDGREPALSNVAFDASLRARNPEWGVRRLGEVEAEARRNGLRLERVVEMPSNNLMVVFQREGAQP